MVNIVEIDELIVFQFDRRAATPPIGGKRRFDADSETFSSEISQRTGSSFDFNFILIGTERFGGEFRHCDKLKFRFCFSFFVRFDSI